MPRKPDTTRNHPPDHELSGLLPADSKGQADAYRSHRKHHLVAFEYDRELRHGSRHRASDAPDGPDNRAQRDFLEGSEAGQRVDLVLQQPAQRQDIPGLPHRLQSDRAGLQDIHGIRHRHSRRRGDLGAGVLRGARAEQVRETDHGREQEPRAVEGGPLARLFEHEGGFCGRPTLLEPDFRPERDLPAAERYGAARGTPE